MKNIKIIRWSAIFLLFAIFFGSVSCISQKEDNIDPVLWRDSAYFETKEIIPEYASAVDYQYRCQDIASKGYETAVILNYMDEDDFVSARDSIVLFLDAEGDQIAALPIYDEDGFTSISATYMLDGRLAVLGFSQMRGYSLQIISASRDLVEASITLPSIYSYYVNVIEYEHFWVFLSYSSIIVTDKNGQLISENELPSEPYPYRLFDLDGRPSVWAITPEMFMSIISLDLDSGNIIEITFENDDEYWGAELYRDYIINHQGVFRIDFSSDKLTEIANWNTIDIMPSRHVYNQTEHFILDDDTILRIVRPVIPGENDELVFMKHCEINPHADKPVLTIGGYGLAQSDIIQYAAYLYNTSDYAYRIEIVEYNDKYGVPYDLASMSRARAEMLRDMNSGNSEDIYFGFDFDYNVWGQADMVADLTYCIDNDPDFDLNMLVPAIVSLIEHEGHIYQMFPSFGFAGFVGYSDLLISAYPMTIEQALMVAEKLSPQQSLFNSALKVDMAMGAIQYNLDDFYTEDEGFSISMEELQLIVDYADRFGTTEANLGDTMLSDPYTAYVNERLILIETGLGSPYSYNQFEQVGTSTMQFFGIPSVYDSVRLCYPGTPVAISSGSQDVDACWDFIKILFSEELQYQVLERGGIPVSQDMFELQIDRAMNPSLMTPQEEFSYMFSSEPRPMSEETVQRYRDCVDSLNAIYSLDADLRMILWEELNAYFEGGKPLFEVHNALNNRMNLFLSEMRQ